MLTTGSLGVNYLYQVEVSKLEQNLNTLNRHLCSRSLNCHHTLFSACFIHVTCLTPESFWICDNLCACMLSLSVVSNSFDPMGCSPPGSSVHGILQARIVEWVAVPFSRGSSQHKNRTQASPLVGGFFTSWATVKVLCAYREHEAGWRKCSSGPWVWLSYQWSRLQWWMLGSAVLSLWALFGQLPTVFLAQLTTTIWQWFCPCLSFFTRSPSLSSLTKLISFLATLVITASCIIKWPRRPKVRRV